MKLENVGVSISGYGTCLCWDHKGSRFHVWMHTPNTIFKNPPRGVKPRQPGYFPTRHLDATKKDNLAMVAEAERIAKDEGLYSKAEEAKRQEEADTRAKHKAAIILTRKHKAAEVMYEALEFSLRELRDMTTVQFSQGKDKAIRDRIREALAKADGQE